MTAENALEDRLPNWSPDMPTVQEVGEIMRTFGGWDYSVFGFMLVTCGLIGVYFGFVKKSSGEDEYLVGGRNMKTIPVSMSLIASFISGTVLLVIIDNRLKRRITATLRLMIVPVIMKVV